MKKRIWISAIALAMVWSFSISAYAAGWSASGSDWMYLDDNNNKVVNTWKNGADGKPRWLNSSGIMAKNAWVDGDTYYVDSNGLVVKETWKQIDNYWYYFDNNGKAITEKWKQINSKWYYFDELSRMQTGWILEDMYYIGSDGAMLTGWQELTPAREQEDSSGPSGLGGDNGKKWYYFGTNGKKYVPNDGAEYGERKINGVRYAFDETGAMLTGWVDVNGGGSSSIRDFKYYKADGTAVTGWYSEYPPETLTGNTSDEVNWYYFNTNGVPKAAESSTYTSNDLIKINSKTYLFNEKGNPVSGLRQVTRNNGEVEYYYFGTDNQRFAQTGKINVPEGDGDSATYYFANSGKGYTGVKDSYLYYNGKLQKADKGTKYQVISVPNTNGTYSNYLVSTVGKVMKSKNNLKDGDGTKYSTNANGIVTKMDDEAVSNTASFAAPIEPIPLTE